MKHAATSPSFFGEDLVADNLISEDQLRIALREQKETRLLLGQTLVRLGFLKGASLTDFLSRKTSLPILHLLPDSIDPPLLHAWPKAMARRTQAMPLSLRNGILHLAVTDPFDLATQDMALRRYDSARSIELFLIDENQAQALIDSAYGASDGIETLLTEIEGGAAAHEDGALVRLLDQMLADAVAAGASDLHFEPEKTFVRVRQRIDGRLREVRSLHRDHWPALSHRIKILGAMNVADTRSVQDGRFRQTIEGHDIDFRVSLMPTVWGETIVVRLLDHRRGVLALEDLGFDATSRQALESILDKPEGLMLVTGPTGSGKTTTLYALLRQISSTDVNIVTLEEPVEYQLPLLRQTSVCEDMGLGFAEGVRALLRMDPDIVFIGEIRDAATAQNALRAAMTGHRVFSTLHCADALGAIPRLTDLGLSPKLLTGNLGGLMAQRLVPMLCPSCKTWRRATAWESERLGCDPSRLPQIAEGQGCAACHGLGVKGRIACTEILPLTPEIDDLIAADAGRLTLLHVAQKAGFRRMKEDGARRVLEGQISFTDLARVIDMRKGS